MQFSRPAPQDATQAEMEAGTEAAARTMSPLLVAQAIAALGGGGATFCYKQASNTDYNGSGGLYTIEPASLQITVSSTGLWEIWVFLNIYKASLGTSTAFRLAMNGAAISGSTGWPAGITVASAAVSHATITTGSPTIVSGGSRSPGSQDLVFLTRYSLNITTAGGIKLQMLDGSSSANIFKLLDTSFIFGVKRA